MDKTQSVASVESTLTPLSSLHRGESTVNVPVVGNRDADRPQALLHERQEGRGVRSPPSLPGGGDSFFQINQQFPLLEGNCVEAGRMESVQRAEHSEDAGRDSQGERGRQPSEGTGKSIPIRPSEDSDGRSEGEHQRTPPRVQNTQEPTSRASPQPQEGNSSSQQQEEEEQQASQAPQTRTDQSVQLQEKKDQPSTRRGGSRQREMVGSEGHGQNL